MGLRYRKQIKVAPGIKLNVSKSGISTSVGKRGATMNFSSRGTKATVGIPGSGISYSKQLTSKKNKQHGSNPKDLEKQVRKDSGLSKREMGELKRMIKKDRRRFVGLSDEQIVSEVRLSYKKRQRTITWIAVILLIAVIVYALTNKI